MIQFKDRNDAILCIGGFLAAVWFAIAIVRAIRTGASGATIYIPSYKRATPPIRFYSVVALEAAFVVLVVVWLSDRLLNGAG